jgi:hypothetical protein
LLDSVTRLDLKGNGLASKSLNEDLHAVLSVAVELRMMETSGGRGFVEESAKEPRRLPKRRIRFFSFASAAIPSAPFSAWMRCFPLHRAPLQPTCNNQRARKAILPRSANRRQEARR